MIAKLKAKELFEKNLYLQMLKGDIKADKEFAKESSLLIVNEIIHEYEYQLGNLQMKSLISYWEDVKNEIKLL